MFARAVLVSKAAADVILRCSDDGDSVPMVLVQQLTVHRRSRRPLYHCVVALGNLGARAIKLLDR